MSKIKKIKNDVLKLVEEKQDLENDVAILQQKKKDMNFISGYEKQIDVLKSAKLELQRKDKFKTKKIVELESHIDTIQDVEKNIIPQDKLVIKPEKKHTKSQGIANIVLSDWHVETPIDYRAVYNKNKFNLDIADSRIKTAIKKSIRLVNIERATTNINHMVLALLGDFMGGTIHEEISRANTLLPMPTVLWLYQRMKSMIDYYIEHGGFKKITVICHVGNHSRTTKKNEYIDYVKKSWEWLLYHFLAIAFKGNDKVEFHIPLSYQTYFKEFNYSLRFHHGERIKYSGGVYGVSVPATKKIKDWNDAVDKVDMDVFGHFHTYSTPNNFIANGSLCGYDPLGSISGYKYDKPKQAFFLIHEKFGLIVNRPIYVE
jgi:hypothetical protein